MIVVKDLVWDGANRQHIKKHKVTVGEIEEICRETLKNQPGYGGRILIFGKTRGGRRLTIVLFEKKAGIYYVVTARDMSKKERRYFLDGKKQDS